MMDLRKSISEFFSKLGGDDASNLDDDFVTYLEESLKVCEDDVDIDQLFSVCDAYLPNFQETSREKFYSWFAETRTAFFSGTNGQEPTASSRFGGTNFTEPKPIPSPTGSDSNDVDGVVDSNGTTPLDVLVNMFPKLCQKKLKHYLRLAHGDLGRAINLALDQTETASPPGSEVPKADQPTPAISSSLTGMESATLSAEERASMMERYGVVKAERKSDSSPLPFTGPEEKKSNIRYLDGKVVDTKGKKYLEIAPEYPNMPQPQFLKALKRYKKH